MRLDLGIEGRLILHQGILPFELEHWERVWYICLWFRSSNNIYSWSSCASQRDERKERKRGLMENPSEFPTSASAREITYQAWADFFHHVRTLVNEKKRKEKRRIWKQNCEKAVFKWSFFSSQPDVEQNPESVQSGPKTMNQIFYWKKLGYFFGKFSWNFACKYLWHSS